MIIEFLVKSYPELKLKLLQARVDKKPKEFIKQNLVMSIFVSLALLIVILLFLKASNAPLPIVSLIVIALVSFIFVFKIFMNYPDAIIKKQEHEIAKEIVFAGRYLIIEAKSGVPLYNSMVSLAENFNVLGRYFKEIIDKVNMGTTMEDAISEAVETTPSNNFRKILWQILNSLKTGADISTSLDGVVQQITKEQMIDIKEYGKKLNPLAMFYMMIAVIIPTLGIVFAIVITSFMGVPITLTGLLIVAFFIALMQLMFLMMVKSSRPAVEF